MPCTHPHCVGQAQLLPGGPGGCAQHQNFWVKQMVPGAWEGTWATAVIAEAARNTTTAHRFVFTARLCSVG